MRRIFVFLFSIFTFTNSFSQVNLTQGLAAYYPFSGNANDVSGNNNNPVFNNATLTTDRFGNANSAYHFDGSSSYMKILNNSSINFGSNVSVCAWVKVSGFYYGACHENRIVNKSETDVVGNGNYALTFNDAHYTGANCSNPIPDTIHENFYGADIGNANNFLQKNIWYSLVWTYDGNFARFYVNCQLVDSNSITGRNYTNPSDLYLGKMNAAAFPYWFNGDLDEVRLYNRAINSDEVKAYGNCATASCTSWLKAPSTPSYVECGSINVTGDKLTVEAIFNNPSNVNTTNFHGGKIVSKHTNAADCNYSLMDHTCEITTQNTGYIYTPKVCFPSLDKQYHVAMVYDGSLLKFYRDGILMSQIAASGNLVQNNLLTAIAQGSAASAGALSQYFGLVNEVRIWNVARTQQQIQQYMNDTLPNPTTQIGLQAYYTFNSLKNKQGNLAFDGVLKGAATISETNPNCSFVLDSCGFVVPCNLKPEFSFTQNICNPKQITFSNQTSNATSLSWDFGNSTNSNVNNPVVNYAAYNNYNVKLVATSSSGCKDSITKNVAVNVTLDTSLIINKDTSICLGATFKINVKDTGMAYCWSASSGSVISNATSQTVAPAINTIYYFNSKTIGNNLVVNGDFESGNTGFQSDYTYHPGTAGGVQGIYHIANNPNVWLSAFNACSDHTSGAANDKMMMADGSTVANTDLWKQTVTIQPNTDYLFSGWLQSIVAQNPAQLVFKINGVQVGTTLTAITTACNWSQFSTVWNSGNNTTANLSITDINLLAQGNDFAIDDISFAPVIIKTDSVKVDVVNCPKVSPCKSDFSFSRTVCGSLNFGFRSFYGTDLKKIYWDYGTGKIDSTSYGQLLIHYPSFKIYTVKMIAVYNSGCSDTVVKKIDIVPIFDTTIINVKTNEILCSGDSLKLKAIDSTITYCWEAPALGLGYGNHNPPTVKTPITYQFYTQLTNGNLIKNSGFENGNIDFISFYNYQIPPNTNNGRYYVGSNPNSWNSSFNSCADHTTTTGKMLIVQSDTAKNKTVWQQDVLTTINTNYRFSFWLQFANPSNVYYFNVLINGVKVQAFSITKGITNCSWTNYYFDWNSGNNINAQIAIVNENYFNEIKNFALDDILFAPVITKTDSVKVDVTNCNINPACKGAISLHGHDNVIPPQTNYKKYFPATGFTWETWFNGSYYDNSNTTINTRSKLIAATDFPAPAQDIVLGFGWPQVAQKNELCFVVDGPNGATDRDNTPCTYFPSGGFLPNTWYHVAAVRDYANNTSKLYVNGVLVDSKTNIHQPLNPNSNIIFPNFYFGSMTGIGATDSAFAGKMDEVRIWNYPRTASDIQSSYNQCLNGNETGLVAYYRCNEKTGTTLHDASINGNNATVSTANDWDKTLNAPIVSPCLLATNSYATASICQGQSYWGHSISGTFVDTFVNSLGCDSLRNLTLTIITAKRDTISKSICQGQNYLGYSTTGTFNDTFHIVGSCDSIRTLKLSVTNCVQNCKGVIELHSLDNVILPVPQAKYYPATGFTWECWFKLKTIDNTSTNIDLQSLLISALDPVPCEDMALGFGWKVGVPVNTLGFTVDGSGPCTQRDQSPCSYRPTNGFIVNNWYHVAGVRDYNNNQTKLYVNGQLVDTKVNTGSPITKNMDVQLGRFNWNVALFAGIDGSMDEVRIWNYPRSASDIQTSYDKCLSGNETGLVTYYRSNETSAIVLKDASINGNDGTLGSTVVINKTLNAPLNASCQNATFYGESKDICQGQKYWGHDSTKIYNDTLVNSAGCDSIRILNLKVLPAAVTTKDTITGCGAIVLNGITYTKDTLVTNTTKNYLGCDSIVLQHQVITNSYIKHIIDTSICQGQNYLGYNATGSFSDTFHIVGSCDSIRILKLTLREPPYINLPSDTSICQNDSIVINLSKSYFYQWNNGSVSNHITVKNIGLYTVNATDSFGCKATDSFHLISLYPSKKDFLPNPYSACSGEQFTLPNFISYHWMTGETTATITLHSYTNYSVQAIDSNGCVGSDTMKVIYLGSENFSFVNAFSPNNDGTNDFFKPLEAACVSEYEMTIFDRWGQQVFQTHNVYGDGWNGKYNGSPAPVGVYYYIINYKSAFGVSKKQSGSVALLR